MDTAALLPDLIEIADKVGKIAQEIRADHNMNPQLKDDGTIVTRADPIMEEVILQGLQLLTPKIPVVGEESVSAGTVPDLTQSEYFWLVDPLDGTRAYAKGWSEYTVNIALIRDGQPILGVVTVPDLNERYWGGVGVGAFYQLGEDDVQTIRVREADPESLLAVVSSFSTKSTKLQEFLLDYPSHQIETYSSSMKFCMIAAGRADFYPRLGPTCEWDTAAAHAILNAAGGHIVRKDNHQELTYGHVDSLFRNPEFIALGDKKILL